MWLKLLPVLLLCLNLGQIICDGSHYRVSRQVGKTCTTPDDKSGTCIILSSCPVLYNMMINDGHNQDTVTFLRRSQCSRTFENGMPMVCCAGQTSSTGGSSPTSRPSSRPPTSSRTTSKPIGSSSNNYGECGKSEKKDIRIVGGKNATLGDWPWMVALGYRTSNRPLLDFKCGATLISNKWVLTAAHCVQQLGNFQLTTARLGDLDLDSNVADDATPIDEPIEEIIPHPKYTTNPITNDIALLKLKNTVKFTKYIRPICLLSGSESRADSAYYNKRPFIIGWGAIEWRGVSSTILQETNINIVNNTDCSTIYAQQRTAKIDERVLCAGERGRDTCQGDSGGPLIFPKAENKTFYLGGIVSFGVRCADLTYPGVYTRVAAFTDWISETTGLDF